MMTGLGLLQLTGYLQQVVRPDGAGGVLWGAAAAEAATRAREREGAGGKGGHGDAEALAGTGSYGGGGGGDGGVSAAAAGLRGEGGGGDGGKASSHAQGQGQGQGHGFAHGHERGHGNRFFTVLARIDWDTLLFFYGIILAVGALGILGYLQVLAKVAYHDLVSLSPPPSPSPILWCDSGALNELAINR